MSRGKRLTEDTILQIMAYLDDHDYYDTMREFGVSKETVDRVDFIKFCESKMDTTILNSTFGKRLPITMVALCKRRIYQKLEELNRNLNPEPEPEEEDQIEFENGAVLQAQKALDFIAAT